MHSLKIVHRDLKPDNILLRNEEDEESIVIADFGLSTFLVDTKEIIFKRCGTPGFVAPEVLNYSEK